VFLSYNRPTQLVRSIQSAVENADYPVEVIVHDDGSDPTVQPHVLSAVSGIASTIICNYAGHNEGVGRAINRSFAVATGDPVVKLDQDLTFEPRWLRKAVQIIDYDESVGMLGLFKYNVDPVDHRKMRIGPGGPWGSVPYDYVKDFVGSAMVVPRSIYEMFGPFPEHSDAFAEDVEFKTTLRNASFNLALPREDLAKNHGFGIGPTRSTLVSGTEADPVITKIHHGPVVF
jgi:GT2 family glycosyltransferase